MTITPTFELTLNARVTPADVLAATNDSYRLGFVAKTIELPAAANQVFTRNIVLNAAETLDLTLQTMLLETTDGGTAPKNADGVALALTKIFVIAFEITAASATVETVTVDAAAAASAWTAYPALKIPMLGTGSLALISTIDTDGFAVDASDQIAFTAGAGTGTITVKMIAIGYQA